MSTIIFIIFTIITSATGAGAATRLVSLAASLVTWLSVVYR